MIRLEFVKMEGAGNDYVYVDGVRNPFPFDRAAEIAVAVADRHYGIGGDGLIVLCPSECADVRMRMWNRDGSRGAMCGNGLRCVARLARETGLVERDEMHVETDAGVRRAVVLRGRDGRIEGARVDLGPIHVAPEDVEVRVGDRAYRYRSADAGNPHAVVFVDQPLAAIPLEALAEAVGARGFPDGVNVEAVRVLGDAVLEQRTWERGSGETLACGSGAGAAARVARVTGRVCEPRVEVRLRGGELVVEETPAGLFLEGPARRVFEGSIELP